MVQSFLLLKVLVLGFGGAEDMLQVMVKGWGYPSVRGYFSMEDMFVCVLNRLMGRANVLVNVILCALEVMPMWHVPLLISHMCVTVPTTCVMMMWPRFLCGFFNSILLCFPPHKPSRDHTIPFISSTNLYPPTLLPR